MSGEAIALLSALLWAFSSVLLAIGTQRLHLLSLNLIRCLVSTAFFWGLLPFFGGWRAVGTIPADRYLWLLLSVLMLLIIGDLLYFRSLNLAGVSWALPVASINPLWVVFFAALFAGEPLTWELLAGAVLVIVGIVLISRSNKQEEVTDSRRQRAGLLLALLASVLWAVGQISLKMGAEGINPVIANSVRQPMGAVLMLGLSVAGRQWQELRRIDRRSLLIVGVASLVGTGIGSFFFIRAIQLIGAGRSAVLTSTTPLMAIPLAMIALHERPRRQTLVGGVLAVAGIALVA